MIDTFERPVVISMGMCTPIGLDAATTSIEFAAGTLQVDELAVLDRRNEPVRGSALAMLANVDRTQRMAVMGSLAAAESLERAASLGLVGELPVFVGLPEDDGVDVDLDRIHAALAQIEASRPAREFRLRFTRDWACRRGRAGFFFALDQALALLDTHTTEAVLLGGVDSLCDVASLQRLVREGRIQGDAVDGLIPGEGAGFVVLARADRWSRRAPGAFAVLGTALGEHRGEVGAEVGNALAQVFRRLRAHPAIREGGCNRLLTCQTGESHWAKEFGTAYLRNGPVMPEPMTYDFVAESFGACGAASGALAMCIAQQRLALLGDAAQILVYGSSDRGSIGACMLRAGRDPSDLGSMAVAQVVSSGQRFATKVPEPARESEHARLEGHLEDISGWIDERRFDLESGARSWLDIEALEARIERRVHALLLGGERAFDLARSAIETADPNLEAGGLCLASARGALDSDLQVVRAGLAKFEPLHRAAPSWRWIVASDALRLGEHPLLDSLLLGLIRDSSFDPIPRRAWLELASRRRGILAPTLAALLHDVATPHELRVAASLALGRLGARESLPAIVELANQDQTNPSIVEALLRLGMGQALDLVRWASARPEPDPAMVRLLGLVGSSIDAQALAALLAHDAFDLELRLAASDALGCIGLTESIPALLHAWASAGESLAGIGLALHRITGAQLEPEPPNDDDDEDDDAEHPPLTSRSLALTRINRDPRAWQQWWSANHHRFAAGQHYRDGEPMRPDSSLAELERADATPLHLRRLAADEFAIRSGLASAFEPDAPIRIQRRALAQWRSDWASRPR